VERGDGHAVGLRFRSVEDLLLAWQPDNVFATLDNNQAESTGPLTAVRPISTRVRSVSLGLLRQHHLVRPVNTNVLILGGINLWISTDGGSSFNGVGHSRDQHAIVANPLFNDTTVRGVVVGNYGGVFSIRTYTR